MAMHRSLDNILPQNERKEISWFLHTQSKELQSIRNELIHSIESNVLWSIIIETKEQWMKSYNDILKRRNIKIKSRTASKIKRITKAILCFYKKEKTREDTSDNIKHTFNKEIDKNEAERIKQEKIIAWMHIRNYLGAKDKKPFWIFKTYFLERQKEWWNFHESADYAIKKICEIYRRENNEEIQELFKDWARGNPYLKEETEEDINNLLDK